MIATPCNVHTWVDMAAKCPEEPANRYQSSQRVVSQQHTNVVVHLGWMGLAVTMHVVCSRGRCVGFLVQMTVSSAAFVVGSGGCVDRLDKLVNEARCS
jgi:hypothetical protein